MNQTSGDSSILENEKEIICMTVGKEPKKELQVEQAVSKDNAEVNFNFTEAKEGYILENDTIKTAEGKVLKLTDGSYQDVKENRRKRHEQKVVQPKDKENSEER